MIKTTKDEKGLHKLYAFRLKKMKFKSKKKKDGSDGQPNKEATLDIDKGIFLIKKSNNGIELLRSKVGNEMWRRNMFEFKEGTDVIGLNFNKTPFWEDSILITNEKELARHLGSAIMSMPDLNLL